MNTIDNAVQFNTINTINIRAYESGTSVADRSDELLIVATQRNKALKEGERAKQSVCASVPSALFSKDIITANLDQLLPAITNMLVVQAREIIKDAANSGKWEIPCDALSISALLDAMESVSSDGSRISTASIAQFFTEELADIIRVQAEIALGYDSNNGINTFMEEKLTIALDHYRAITVLAASKGPVIGAKGKEKMQFGMQEIDSYKRMITKYFSGTDLGIAVMETPMMSYIAAKFASFEVKINEFIAAQNVALDDAL